MFQTLTYIPDIFAWNIFSFFSNSDFSTEATFYFFYFTYNSMMCATASQIPQLFVWFFKKKHTFLKCTHNEFYDLLGIILGYLLLG